MASPKYYLSSQREFLAAALHTQLHNFIHFTIIFAQFKVEMNVALAKKHWVKSSRRHSHLTFRAYWWEKSKKISIVLMMMMCSVPKMEKISSSFWANMFVLAKKKQ